MTCTRLINCDRPFNIEQKKNTRGRTRRTSPFNYPFPILPAVSFQCITGSSQNNCFFAIYKFICTDLIDQNESGIRKQSKSKSKASFNVKIGWGNWEHLFLAPCVINSKVKPNTKLRLAEALVIWRHQARSQTQCKPTKLQTISKGM